MRIQLYLALAAVLLPAAASAATITTLVDVTAYSAEKGAPVTERVRFSEEVNSGSAETLISLAADVQSGSSSAAASVSIDAVSGEIQLYGRNDRPHPQNHNEARDNSSSFTGLVIFKDRFVLNGAGSVTFGFEVDGTLAGLNDGYYGSLSTVVQLRATYLGRTLVKSTGGQNHDTEIDETFDRLFEVTVTSDNFDGEEVETSWYQSIHGSAIFSELNFLNGGRAFVTTTGTATATSQSGFFDTTPAPVPLPAAGWALWVALGSLGAVRARRKIQA